jgi:hypothetical protein
MLRSIFNGSAPAREYVIKVTNPHRKISGAVGVVTCLGTGVYSAREYCRKSTEETLDAVNVVAAGATGVFGGIPFGIVMALTWPVSLPLLGIGALLSDVKMKNPYAEKH